MELTPAHVALLRSLAVDSLQTEHTMAKVVAGTRKIDEADAVPMIGKMLVELKELDLVWCGQVFSKAKQFMWVACLSKAGRERVKHVNAAIRAGASQP